MASFVFRILWLASTNLNPKKTEATGTISISLYSVSTGKVKRNCEFPVHDRNGVTGHQALQDFSDTIQVPLHENNNINSPIL
jgi:hypothetical protein